MTTYAPGSPVVLPQEDLSVLYDGEVKHAGPGPHPGTGTPQTAHGSALGPAMKALTKMLADPDWRFVHSYASIPGAEKTVEIEQRYVHLKNQEGKTWQKFAEVATDAYREVFTENPKVSAPMVQVDAYDPMTQGWNDKRPIYWVQPNPEGEKFARLPKETDWSLKPVWDDEKGEVTGWRIGRFNYEQEYDPHPLEIEATKHLLDSKEKYDALHIVTETYDYTKQVWRIGQYKPKSDEERQAKKALLDYAGKVQREGVEDYLDATVLDYGADAMNRLEAARARPDDLPKDEEVDELDELLGMTGAVEVPKEFEVRQALDDLIAHGENARRMTGDDPTTVDFSRYSLSGGEVVVTNQVAGDAQALKADVAKQVAEEWEADGRKWEEVARAMERMGSRRMGSDMDTAAGALIRTWAETSNDEHDVSLSVQDAASREFTLSGTAGWHKDAPDLSEEDASLLDGTLRSMYARTQRMFEEAGITELRVHRGQSVKVTREGYSMRPLSSWSVDRTEARSFAGSADGGGYAVDLGEEGMESIISDRSARERLLGDPASGAAVGEEVGVVFSATVPVSRVLCTPKTGFGCLGEYEVVLLGGPLEQMVEPLHEQKHMGPGPHPSGTPQSVHAGKVRTGVGYRGALSHLRMMLESPSEREQRIASRALAAMERGVAPGDPYGYHTLSLNWMGEHAPFVVGEDVETTSGRAREYLRSLPTYDESDNAHEQGVSVLSDGSVLNGIIRIGGARSIAMKLDDFHGKDVAVQMHNHPRENPLSAGDVMVGVHSRASRIEAVTRAGEFVLEIDHDALDFTFPRKADSVAQSLQRFAQDAYRDGDLTEGQVRYGTGVALIRVLEDVRPDAFTYREQGDARHAEDEVWPPGILNEFLAAVHREGPLS